LGQENVPCHFETGNRYPVVFHLKLVEDFFSGQDFFQTLSIVVHERQPFILGLLTIIDQRQEKLPWKFKQTTQWIICCQYYPFAASAWWRK
jgi:hypothetical protein